MGWQDNIVYDNQTPPPPATGWQNAIVYDNDNQPSSPANSNSFAQNPTLGNLGNAALEAAQDVPNQFVGGLAHMGRMAEGKDPIITNDFGESANNVMNMVLPFAVGPEGAAKEFQSAVPPQGPSPDIVTPTSSDIKLIKQKLDLAGVTPQQYADALMKSGPDDFAGEVGGDPLRMQTQAQAKITGPAMQGARDAMRQRLADAPQRTADIIGQSIKPAENVNNMLQNIEEMKAQAGPLYADAFTSTVPLDKFSDIVGTPSGQTALQKTVTDFSNANRPPDQMGFSVDQNGKYSLNDDVPVETMHQIQRNIGAQVERDPFGNPTSSPGNQVLQKQQTGITSRLASLNPSYQKALNVSAAYKQATDAFSMGRQLAKSAAGEKADAIMQQAEDVMSPNELSYQRAGYAQGLTDASSSAPLGTGSPASRIATGKVQNSIGSILDSPTQAQQFGDMLMQEKNRVDLAQRGLGGSNTAETLSAGAPSVPTSPEGILSHAANKVMDFVNAGKNERLAQLLYATSPEQKALLAQKISQ